jgi:BASS family bile acid:Na+ symporter
VEAAASGFKVLILLALQVSVFCTVFGFGLDTTFPDMLYLIRRPGFLVRSLIAMFVIMPAVAIGLAAAFEFRHVVEVALVALSISPVPPLLPRREGQAGGRRPYALGLMALLALLSIAIVPAALWVLKQIVHHSLDMSSMAVARAVFETALAPLAMGTIVRALLPGTASRIGLFINRVAWVLLALGITGLLAANLSAIWALVGNGTLTAMAAFVVIALTVGHVLGGPDPEHSAVLALSNACRHPAIAISIASTNFPDEQFGATVLLYVIVNLGVCIPYIRWQRSRMAGTDRPISPASARQVS